MKQKVLIDEINVTCECGTSQTISIHSMVVIDTTKCSCGSCHGESYDIYLGECINCKKELTISK